MRLQLNEKKSKKSQTRLMSWYWKPTWTKDLIRYNIHPWIMFFFNWLVIIWRERAVRLKLYVQGQGGDRILDVDGQGGGTLENWTIFMDVICVSSLTAIKLISDGKYDMLTNKNSKFLFYHFNDYHDRRFQFVERVTDVHISEDEYGLLKVQREN